MIEYKKTLLEFTVNVGSCPRQVLFLALLETVYCRSEASIPLDYQPDGSVASTLAPASLGPTVRLMWPFR